MLLAIRIYWYVERFASELYSNGVAHFYDKLNVTDFLFLLPLSFDVDHS